MSADADTLDADETHVISTGLYTKANGHSRIKVAKALTSTGALQIHKTFQVSTTDSLGYGCSGVLDSNDDLVFLTKLANEAVDTYKLRIDSDASFVSGKQFTMNAGFELTYGTRSLTISNHKNCNTNCDNSIFVFLSYKEETRFFVKLSADMQTVTIKYTQKSGADDPDWSTAVVFNSKGDLLWMDYSKDFGDTANARSFVF